MATSGSSVSSGLANGYTWQVIFDWNRRSYDVASNISLIDWTLSIYRSNPPAVSGTYIYEYGSGVNIDGEQVHTNSTTIQRMTNASSLIIASGTKTIYHNADGTKSFSVTYNASLYSGSNVIGGTETFILDTLPRYANLTEYYVKSVGLNSITLKWNADAGIDYVQYSLNDSAWVQTAGLEFTIGGLSPNTSYNIRIAIRRADSGLWTNSDYIYATTQDIARLSTYSNFNLGDNLTITYTNPSGASIMAGIYGTDGVTPYAPYRAVSGNSYEFNFTDEELDKIYKAMGTNNSISLYLYLATANAYNEHKLITIYLTGNQKTGHVYVNGSWKRTKKWVKVDGTWKRCVRWIKVDGVWKRCI